MKNAGQFLLEPYLLRVEKPWGFELIFSKPDSLVTSKILHVNRGKRSSLQFHDEKEEVLTLLSGHGILELEDSNGDIQKFDMELRKAYTIKTNQKHRFSAGHEDCEIMESSTPEKGNTIRLEDDYKRDTETEAARSTRKDNQLYNG